MSGAVFALVKRWKEFDFAELQGVMDSEAADITCRQDMCEMSRNTLVELTRQFRRDTPEDVRKQVVPVLKNYQSEVDRLSQRCKTAETAFLNVYKKMIDCPDMQPVLEYVVAADTEMKRLADVNMHNEQLRQTIDDLQHELQQAQQHESTVEKMKDQLAQYDQHQQQLVEAAVSEKQKELSAELDECRQMQHDTQLLSGRKLAEAEDRVNQLAAALEMSQNEVLQVKAQLEGLSGSRTDELDMLTVDLERCNERAALAEREVHVLKEQLAASHQNQHPQHASSLSCAEDDLNDGELAASQRSAVEHQLAAKEKEISQLVEEVQRLQSQLSQLETQCLSQRVQLEDQLGERNSIISRLESVLDRQKDYDDVKKELEIMKSVEFSGASQLCDEDGHQVIDTSQSLEVLIMEKNRALQNETTALKNNNAHLQGDADAPDGGDSDRDAGPWPPPPPPSQSGCSDDYDRRSPLAGSPGIGSSSPRANVDDDEPLSPPSLSSSATSAAVLPTTTTGVAATTSSPSGNGSRTPTSTPVTAPVGCYRYDENDPLIPKSDPIETRLQEMLRYNMDKFSSQSLDTLQLSRRVRELLSVNNIGQRMFARYILGLSQGTVSELLSKPKCWEKLTEKGRDSYRKMHAWAVDEGAVYLLKTIIPRKGKDGRVSYSARDEEGSPSLAEDRIAHILSEATMKASLEHHQHHLPHLQQQQLPSCYADDTRSPVSTQSPPAEYRDVMAGRLRGCFASADSVDDDVRLSGAGGMVGGSATHERLARLYQQQLAKLMTAVQNPTAATTTTAAPSAFHVDSLHRMRSPEEVRMAIDIYNQELMKHMRHHIQQQQQHNGISGATTGHEMALESRCLPPTLSPRTIGEDSGQSGGAAPVPLSAQFVRVKAEEDSPKGAVVCSSPGVGCHLPAPPSHLSALHSGGSFFVHPASAAAVSTEDVSSGGSSVACTVSPLQRMASITNSLMSSAGAPSLPSHAQRSLKAVLPPITQQQFDQFSSLNTDEIVRRVKEHLSQFSISQRLFGESVLGLSQGSVSDLLARPKPWHMLTQKGREPFIRMQMFLSDENAVHKLVASQYKIAPEKLMRTGCYNGAGFVKLPLRMPDISRSLDSSPTMTVAASVPSLPPPSLVPSSMAGLLSVSRLASVEPLLPPVKFAGVRVPACGGGGGQSAAAMSVYETAAITPELDTQLITTRIKEVLLANNIGQKLFGETVLGLSQGSVSELLSKPKPWQLLSIKGREPFIRMKMWLEDAHNVDKLQRIKCERKETNKRRRCQLDQPTGGGSGASNGAAPFDAAVGVDGGDLYSSMTGSPGAKKARVLFSDEQKEALRLAFSLDAYPSVACVEYLSRELSLTPRTITNWFHNHRMRLKQAQPAAVDERAAALTCGDATSQPAIQQQQLDPVQFRLMLNARLLEMHREKTTGSGLSALSLAAAAAAAASIGTHAPAAVSLAASSLMSTGGGVMQPCGGLDLSMKSEQGSDDAGSCASAGPSPPPPPPSAPVLPAPDQQQGVTDGEELERRQAEYDSLADTAAAAVPLMMTAAVRTSRRKPAAPQWVNPQWSASTCGGVGGVVGGVGGGGSGGSSDATAVVQPCVESTDTEASVQDDSTTTTAASTTAITTTSATAVTDCAGGAADRVHSVCSDNQHEDLGRHMDCVDGDECAVDRH